ncbi:GAF and ANTAR domain-containing protein [Nocardia sp. NPDC050710]|uniref:GAF and ANTAR domain-containing protein n=1 Tax=Nocardia sp. NPDC050710 TaxID=3157220 RepID=UPI0033E4F885
MSDSELLVTAVSKLAQLLADSETAAVLYQVIDSATDILDLAGGTVLLISDGRTGVITATPEELAEIPRRQQDVASGPGMDAIRRGEPVVVTDLRSQHRVWPEYASAALRHGVSSVAEIPMRSGAKTVGALGLYATAPRAWTGSDLAVGALLAGMAAGHLVAMERLREQQVLAAQLQHALDSRVLIEQAKGVIANARNISPDSAYKLIRAHARRNRISVHAVATGIVELRLRI